MKTQHGWSPGLCKLSRVTADLEGQDFTMCSWFVCRLSRHGAVYVWHRHVALFS